MEKHPEIRDVQIKSPMLLTGLPRAHIRVTELAVTRSCRASAEIMGRYEPGSFTWHNPPECEDPRYVQLKAFYEEAHKKNPDFDKIHFTSADTPEECIHLLNHTFQDVQFGVETMMEPYGSWFQQQDHMPSYRYYADILRMLQWRPVSVGC
ncbi:MAG: hypothetical protein IPK95_05285 [Cellvibrionales bacterium]|nr:hypothetical protein [Cellvibrionales bacterium]